MGMGNNPLGPLWPYVLAAFIAALGLALWIVMPK